MSNYHILIQHPEADGWFSAGDGASPKGVLATEPLDLPHRERPLWPRNRNRGDILLKSTRAYNSTRKHQTIQSHRGQSPLYTNYPKINYQHDQILLTIQQLYFLCRRCHVDKSVSHKTSWTAQQWNYKYSEKQTNINKFKIIPFAHHQQVSYSKRQLFDQLWNTHRSQYVSKKGRTR